MSLTCYDRTLPTVAANLALDEALLLAAESGTGRECLRFWEWPTYAVVLGANGIRAQETNMEPCERDGVAIFRRSSGGGTVLVGPGCLQYSLVLNYERAAELTQVNSSYRWILERIAQAFASVGHVDVLGSSDLCVQQRKFSGNAQQRKARYLLHHGTLLYDFDISHIERYLPLPPRMPDYRNTRPHDAFVMNLPLSATMIKQALRTVFEATAAELPETILEEATRLTATKFATPEWIERR